MNTTTWYQCKHCDCISDSGTYVGCCGIPKEERGGIVDLDLWTEWREKGFPDVSLHSWRYVGKGTTFEEAVSDGILTEINKLGGK